MTGPVTALYDELGIALRETSGSDAATRCFAAPDRHEREDRHPSASVNLRTGAWTCHACGARGGAYDAALLRGHTPRTAMDLLIRHGLAERRHYPSPRPRRPARNNSDLDPRVRTPVTPRPIVTREQIGAWHDRLLAQHQIVEDLRRLRAIDQATLQRFQIGWDGARITIPVAVGRPDSGVLRWRPFERSRSPKMLAVPGTRRQLFPPPEAIDDRDLVICEGEPDALAAHSAGIPAVAIPGVASWRPEWAPRFQGRTVTIILDCDTPGRRCSASIALDLGQAGIDAAIVDLAPGRNDGYDLTDHLTGA